MEEAIGAVAVPSVRDRVIAAALQLARFSRIPERGPEVGAFVRGALFRALEASLGAEAAAAVRDELNPVAEKVARDEVSEVRASWPGPPLDEEPELTFEPSAVEPRPLTPTNPFPERELPLLLIASSDPSSVGELGRGLRGIAFLEPVRDALSVLEGFGRTETALVVLDCRHPTVRAETLLALQPELPERSRVVLWGEPPGLESQLASLGGGLPDTWVLCGHDATADDVAAICRVLLE